MPTPLWLGVLSVGCEDGSAQNDCNAVTVDHLRQQSRVIAVIISSYSFLSAQSA